MADAGKQTFLIPDDNDKLLTSDQVANLRQCSRSKVEKERLIGEGPPFIRDGSSVRYRLGDYRAWVAAQRRFTSTSEAA
jgi:hypothetical protein